MVDGTADAEIRDESTPILQQHVLRLDVAVQESLSMCVIQGVRDFHRDPGCLGNRQLPLPGEPGPQRVAGYERRGVPESTRALLDRNLSGIEQRQNVRVDQVRGEVYFPAEPGGADRVRDVRIQHLDRNVAAMSDIAGEEDRGHAATAELTLQRVPAGQPGLHFLEQRRHGGAPGFLRWRFGNVKSPVTEALGKTNAH